MRATIALTFGILFIVPVAAINGGIVDRSDNVIMMSAPLNFREGNLEDSASVHLLAERLDFTLPVAIPLDVAGPFLLDSADDYVDASIADGAAVNVYYLHFDPANVANQPRFIEGYVTFDEEVIGLIARTESLRATHPILGLPDVTYPSGDFQGIEPNAAGSYIALSPDLRTVSFRLAVSDHVDTFRVITSVPEAPPFALIAAGAGVMLLVRLTRRRHS